MLSPVTATAEDLPDLEAGQIQVTNLYAGTNNTVTAVINNNTDAAAESFSVRLEADGAEVASSSGNYLSGNQDMYYWPLSVNLNWTPETSGAHSLKIIVDPEGTVDETNETNNEITRDVTVNDLSEITVNIRVEGQNATIWSGEATFQTSTITDKQGETHTFDHPTALGALQEAAEAGSFNYEVSSAYGTCSFVESVAGEANSGMNGWLYMVNWSGADCAAVDYTLAEGDEVLWYYGGWAAAPLKISADQQFFSSDDSFTVTVKTYNGAGWDPVEAATVYAGSHIYTTNAAGQVENISLPPGGYSVYAEKEDYNTFIRSNKLEVTAYIPMELKPGWNFFSIPKKLKTGSSTVGSLFGGVNTDGHSIFAYDPEQSQNGWRALEENDTLNPLDGTWIYSATTVQLYPGFDPDPLQTPTTKGLAAGWNAVGFSDFNAATANAALTSVENKWAYLIGFDAATQSYEVSIVNNTPEGDAHSETRMMGCWKGYWLYMTEEGELAAISN
jgi:hypothetical protein